MTSGNTKNFEFKLKKAGLVAVITGMAALLCFAFLLGVNVGKNIDTYPEKISSLPQKTLALIWHKGKLQTAENLTDDKNPSPQSKEEDIDLTFYNTLTGKKGVVREKAAPGKKQVIETPPPIVAPLQKNNEETVNDNDTLETPKQPPDAVADKKKEEAKSKIKETTPSAAPGKHKYIVQAASLKEKAKAYQLTKTLAALGFDPKIIPIEIKGKGTWYRVIISGFDNKAKAQEAAAKISRKTGTNCIIRSADSANN
jgi:cell division protein FtsN